MKQLFKILIFLLLIKNAYSQNLVPNPSFENYYDCSAEWLYVSNAIGWTGMQSSDYYNSCIVPTWIIHTDVPQNTFGYQQAKSGNAYSGIFTFVSPQYREYVQVNLTQPLLTNINYCVSFNIALADTSKYAIKKIGAYFSVDTIIYPFVITTTPPDYYTFTYYNPQVESNSILSDTSGWTKIEDIFLASGNEEYMTLGNFRDDTSTDTIAVRSNTSYNTSYYYIDDVSVEMVLNANAGNDTSITTADSVQIGNNPTENATYLWQPAIGLNDINSANPMARPNTTTTYIVTKTQCSVITTDTVVVTNLSVGIDEGQNQNSYNIYPNPNKGEFIIEVLEGNAIWQMKISDIQGRVIYKEEFYDKKVAIRPNLETGIYLVRILNLETNETSVKKLIIQK